MFDLMVFGVLMLTALILTQVLMWNDNEEDE